MKIYRAVFEYNNADSCEWERWDREVSSWYSNRELAESHIPILKNFKDYLQDYYSDNCCFRCNDPFIEEREVSEKITPLNLVDVNNIPFTEFKYLKYDGPLEITERLLKVDFPVGLSSFDLILYIGDEGFIVNVDSGNVYKVSERSNYYKYTQEIRDKLINICKDYYNSSIKNLYKNFKKSYESLESKTRESWELQRACGVEYIIKFLSQDYRLKLTNSSIAGIDREYNCWRGKEYPKYRESLEKLLKFIQK